MLNIVYHATHIAYPIPSTLAIFNLLLQLIIRDISKPWSFNEKFEQNILITLPELSIEYEPCLGSRVFEHKTLTSRHVKSRRIGQTQWATDLSISCHWPATVPRNVSIVYVIMCLFYLLLWTWQAWMNVFLSRLSNRDRLYVLVNLDSYVLNGFLNRFFVKCFFVCQILRPRKRPVSVPIYVFTAIGQWH